MRIRVFVLLLAVVAMAVSAQETIKIGYFDNQPFVIPQPGGKAPIGASVDYWTNIVAPAMNVKVEWVGPTPMLRLLKQLETGDIDAVLILGKNPDRAKVYLYPAKPYLHMRPALTVLKDNPLSSISTQDDVAGMRIGYLQAAVVPDFLKTAKVTFDNLTSTNWQQDNFAKLANKRIDAVFNLNVEALAFEASQTYAGKFKFLQLPVPPSDIYTAFAKTDRGAAFMQKYDQVNNKNSTVVDTLIKKYIDVK